MLQDNPVGLPVGQATPAAQERVYPVLSRAFSWLGCFRDAFDVRCFNHI